MQHKIKGNICRILLFATIISILFSSCASKIDTPVTSKITKSTSPVSVNDKVLVEEKVKISASMQPYLFKVYGQRIDKKSIDGNGQTYIDTSYSADRIAVYKTGTKDELIQELTFDKTDVPDKDLGFVIEDMDFDGYKDIRIQQFLPAAPNIPFYYWLWDVKSSKFIRNIEMEEITSPVFNSKNKLITSSERVSAASFYDYTYKFTDDHVMLIKEVDTEYESEPKKQITIKERINGKMKITKQYIETSK